MKKRVSLHYWLRRDSTLRGVADSLRLLLKWSCRAVTKTKSRVCISMNALSWPLDRFVLNRTHVNLRWASLDGVDLADAILSDNENHVGPRLVNVYWGNSNLTVLDWSQVKMLGDEYEARQKRKRNGEKKDKEAQLNGYEEAANANRQLVIALQNQGLDETAMHFAYRSRILQRKAFWEQQNFWRWFSSAILAVLAGYGYRMWCIIAAYLLIVLLCAVAYFVLGMYYEPHLSFLDALLTSVTTFHGRAFSEPFLRSDEPQLWITAFEAVAGLVMEGVFIAMLTQKFFGK